MIKIVGAKGDIQDVDSLLEKVGNFALNHNVIIQLLDADMIYGDNHIISAFEHAKRAMDRKTNTTNSLEMETLLYASGERQLKLAIPKIGIKKGKANIAFVFINQKSKIPDKLVDEMLKLLNLKRDDQVIQGDENTLKKFGISKNEIETVTKAKYGDLVLEKVAMVDIIK